MAVPARYSPLVDIAPHHKPAIRRIDSFVNDIGGGNYDKGRARFLACLCLAAHEDERLTCLLQSAEDPEFGQRTIGDLAVASGFRAGEILKIARETGLMVAQAHALTIVSDHLPAVVQDLVTRAQNHYEQCGVCEGIGKVTPDPTKEQPNPEPETCKTCKGRGQVLVHADPDRQDRVLEIAKLLPKGSGTQIGISTTIGGKEAAGGSASAASFTGLFSQLVAATDRIVHPDRSRSLLSGAPAPPNPGVVEGEVVVGSADDAAPPAHATNHDPPPEGS